MEGITSPSPIRRKKIVTFSNKKFRSNWVLGPQTKLSWIARPPQKRQLSKFVLAQHSVGIQKLSCYSANANRTWTALSYARPRGLMKKAERLGNKFYLAEGLIRFGGTGSYSLLALLPLELERGEFVSLEAVVVNTLQNKSKRLVPLGALKTTLLSRDFPQASFWCSRNFLAPEGGF